MFTLVMRKQHNVTTYDEKGRSASEKRTFLEFTQTGLPAQTVETYRKLFPEAIVSVTREFEETRSGPRTRVRSADEHDGEEVHAAPKPKMAPELMEPVLGGGDYGELVSRMAEREDV